MSTEELEFTMPQRSLSWNRLVSTRLFSEAAVDWKRNGGIYTLAPEGSREYREYWELQEDRCKRGYSVGDTWIPGRFYHWLNFTQILKMPDAKIFQIIRDLRDKRGKVNIKTMEKIMDFPRFYEVGWQWYRFKHIAWHGGKFLHIDSPGGKHMVCAKTRGAGFSYMAAQSGVYNYTFIPGSKSYYFAATEQFLTTDGILSKVKEQLDWTNENIPFWRQNRMEKDTPMHYKGSYKDAFGSVKGNKAEIIGTIVDDPEKTRGKRGREVTFEEAGSFKNLLKALAVCQGTTEDGSFKTGQISVFGTGGEEGPSIEGLENIFDQPDIYGMLAFPNIWDEEMEATTCGFFVPATHTDVLYMDEDGNIDIDGSMDNQLAERKALEGAKDSRKLDMRKAEFPICPREVFSRLARNPFPGALLDKQMNYIQKSTAVQEILRYGDLIPAADGENGWHFSIKTKAEAKPVDDYPHDQKAENRGDLEGCITVAEKPWVNHLGVTPPDIYQMIFDPYYKDESDDVTSLFDATIWKNYNPYSSVNENLPISWYVGRPADVNDAITRMFNMAMWYNAKIQGEIAGGGQAVLDYAKKHHLLHMLDFDLEITDNREITETRNRKYLMNMPTEKKRMGLTYFINWVKEQRGIREDGTPIYNVHKTLKLRLLRECRKFDGKKNADSISNAIVAMFALKEKQARIAKERKDEQEENFYDRELFTGVEEEKGFASIND